MQPNNPRRWPIGILLATAALAGAPALAISADGNPVAADSDNHTQRLRGRVVWLPVDEQPADEASEAPRVALRTADGSLFPIADDVRGRAFRLDPPLREFDWELTLRRPADAMAYYVVRSCVWRDGRKWEFDYWCDICAIPMTYLKECECCQGPIRIRLRLVDPATDRATHVEP